MNMVKQFPTYTCEEFGVQAIGLENQDALAECYLRLKKEGMLPILYPEHPKGSPDLKTFGEMYLQTGSLTMICFTRNTESPLIDVCGLGHVTKPMLMGGDPPVSKSESSMLFFKGKQKRNWTVTWASMMIEMAFDAFPQLINLCGCTPEKNRAAVRFIEAAGFTKVGLMPAYTTWEGKPCGCWISHLTREYWKGRKPFIE